MPVLLLALVWLTSIFVRADEPQDTSAPLQPGEDQVLAVLHDRPELNLLVQHGNPIWNWLVAAFADTNHGYKIKWDPHPVPDSILTPAQSSASPDGNNVCYVKVNEKCKEGPRKGQPQMADEMLNELVFELNNVRHPEGLHLMQLAGQGKITRDAFIRATAEKEFHAARETGDFCRTIFVPFCTQKGLHYDLSHWYTRVPATFDEWMKWFPAGTYYPWQCYGQQFDYCDEMLKANAALAAGHYDDAIAQCTKATAWPMGRPDNAHFILGVAEFLKGDSVASRREMGLVTPDDLARNQSSVDRAHLFVWILDVNEGKRAEADQMLATYFGPRLSLPNPPWETMFAQLLLGRVQDEALFDCTKTYAPEIQLFARATISFYKGWKAKADGDLKAAQAAFAACVKNADPDYPETLVAKVELAP